VDYKDTAYYYKFATYMWKKNDKDKALEVANKFTEYSSTLKNFWYYRGLFFQMQALIDKKEYDKALAVVPAADADKMPGATESEYYNRAGDIYKIQKKYKEAAAAYEKAAKADNAYHGGNGWYQLGDVYVLMSNDSDAITAFKEVLELPDSSVYHKTIAMVRCAELLNKGDKPADAFGMIKKAEALPGADVNWVARGKILAGKILLQQNKKDDAKKQFETVVATKGVSADYVKQAQAELDKVK
jgi:tetratricopeptide (TPR) repeat protein